MMLGREKAKGTTGKLTRLQHARAAAQLTPDELQLLIVRQPPVSIYLTTVHTRQRPTSLKPASFNSREPIASEQVAGTVQNSNALNVGDEN